ncbi:E4.3 [Ovine adenovirus 7]|uniref:E4.3 n=1 Tax=Ovine adenovirus D serotype 7 (isolate OAV287) TaxID=114430 RepID=Q83909_ADEO7|nr:E4.3 [Ovine adenovirus 7]AAD45953.1 E4.3 [Ovine adenovirus 7]
MNSIMCCEGIHHLFYCDIPFVSFKVLESYINVVIFRLLKLYLCDLPCQQNQFHCHCLQPNSLQCQSLKQTLMLILKKVHVRVPVFLPWTNCCTNVLCYSFDDFTVLITRLWNALPLEEEISKIVTDYNRYNCCPMKVLFVFKSPEVQDCKNLLDTVHLKMNMVDLRGFHLPPYDYAYWKSYASIDSNDQPCLLRFVNYRGTLCQERYVKRLLFNKEFLKYSLSELMCCKHTNWYIFS